MADTLLLRAAGPDDIAAMGHVFWRGVQEGAAPCYDAAQRSAWCPKPPDETAFATRLEGLTSFVAERKNTVSGFFSMRDDGYLDFAYVLPEERGRGVADALWGMVLNHAALKNMCLLTTHASHMARPFFARHGWTFEATQTIERNGVHLENHRMSFHRTVLA